MSDVTDIGSARPHRSGPAFCLSCKHEWVAVTPLDGEIPFECPACGRMTGRYQFEFEPPTGRVWQCPCGNQLFNVLETDEVFCPGCGSRQKF